jgi:hypothetical protein
MVHGSGGPSTKVDLVLAIGLGALRRGTESGMAEDVRPGTPGGKPVASKVNLRTKLTTRTMGTGSFIPDTVCTKKDRAILLADPGTHAHTKRQRWE